MVKLAGIFLIFPLIGAALINIYSPGELGGIDWSGSNMRSNQRYIEENPDQWRRDNFSAGLGGIMDAIGVVIFAFAVRQNSKNKKVVLVAFVSTISISLAAATWMFICVNRFTLPPSVVVQNLAIASWTTPAMDIPFVLGTILLGYAVMLRYSKWGGGLIIMVEVAIIVLMFIVVGEIIPATHFFSLLVAGIVLLIIGGASTRMTGTSEMPVT